MPTCYINSQHLKLHVVCKYEVCFYCRNAERDKEIIFTGSRIHSFCRALLSKLMAIGFRSFFLSLAILLTIKSSLAVSTSINGHQNGSCTRCGHLLLLITRRSWFVSIKSLTFVCARQTGSREQLVEFVR